VGVVGGRGEASDEAAGTGVERGTTAGDGGGGIELPPGVERAGSGVDAIDGVDSVFIYAFGSFRYSLYLAGVIRSVTINFCVSVGRLSSRASYLCCRAVRVSL
jgi:hypothetical protein